MTRNQNYTASALGNTIEVLSRRSRRTRFFTPGVFCLLLISSLVTLGVCSSALAQEARKDGADKTPDITASVISDGVRIAAPSAVVQLRLEVYDELGQKLFDTEQQGGNVLDWHLQAGAAGRAADGTYMCVVTVKNPSGRMNKKLGLVTVTGQSISVRSAAVR